MLGYWNKSVYITYLGAFVATTGLLLAISYNNIDYSFAGMIIACVCDMFDGKVARMCKRTKEEKEFGIQIDSLADTVNFVALPVIIMLSLGMTSIIDVIIYAIFIICGISRLGYFNTSAEIDKTIKFFCQASLKIKTVSE